MGMSWRDATLAVVVVAALSTPARAEEGLFVARIGGGVSTVDPDMPEVGGMIAMSMDLCLSEKTGIIAGTTIVRDETFDTLGLSLGIKRLFRERQWTRFYLTLAPEILFIGDDDPDTSRRHDIAMHGSLGFEYVWMWGFGLTFELHGTLPAALGKATPYDAASAGFTAGIFMEF
jgi:hypothetical protein